LAFPHQNGYDETNSSLATLLWWVGWIAVGGTVIGAICAVLTIVATRETSRRADKKAEFVEIRIDQSEKNLERAQTKLSAAEKYLAKLQPRQLTTDQ
jgi:hypothetical protein